MQAETQAMNYGLKPNFPKTANIKLCLTLSKALAMSILIIIPWSPRSLLECMASWTNMMLSIICLFSTKPLWFGEMSLCRRGLILLAMTLVMSL
jgi:hypothetical protein